MKIAFYNIYEQLNKDNFLFENNNTTIADNLLTPMIRLKEYANFQNILVGTTDVISIDEADAIVFIDMPKQDNNILNSAIASNKPLYLLALESPLITPGSYDEVNHKLFKKIFTWSDDLINKDSTKYIKINYAFDIPQKISKDIDSKIKFCCMIAGNKKVSYPNELYSERSKAIRWFEKNHLADFDLYGMGWDEVSTGRNRYINYIMRRSKTLRKVFASRYLSYKGKIMRKKPVLEKYKFSICYENAKDINGYITEKIFDCFFAGCVPVYMGAKNITDYIPKNCFIDKREFNSYEELYNYMTSLSDNDYLKYLDSIEKFIFSEKFFQFSCEYYSQKIIDTMINEK